MENAHRPHGCRLTMNGFKPTGVRLRYSQSVYESIQSEPDIRLKTTRRRENTLRLQHTERE